MSVDRPDETEAGLVDRRLRESDERFAKFWAGVEARRAAGVPDMPCALPPARNAGKFDPHDPVHGRPRRRWV